MSKADRWQAVLAALPHHGKPYNYQFDFRTETALVCSQLVHKAYEVVDGLRLEPKMNGGRPVSLKSPCPARPWVAVYLSPAVEHGGFAGRGPCPLLDPPVAGALPCTPWTGVQGQVDAWAVPVGAVAT